MTTEARLMKGNEALAEAAILAGCDAYFGYPITPQSEVLEYLARYTHRTAIGNERLVSIRNGHVLMRVRADSSGGKRVMAMPGTQFIGRFLQHVLPQGFKRIRHYGLLAPAAKTARLHMARQLLAMPAANPMARKALVPTPCRGPP